MMSNKEDIVMKNPEEKDPQPNHNLQENPVGKTKGISQMLNRLNFFYSKLYEKLITERTKNILYCTLKVMLIALFTAYVIYCAIYNFSESKELLYLTLIGYSFALFNLFSPYFYKLVKKFAKDKTPTKGKKFNMVSKVIGILSLTTLIIFVIFDAMKDKTRFRSAFGLCGYILLTWIFSKNPLKVRWRPVLWGLALQLLLGFFVLRTFIGLFIFEYMGEKAKLFFEFTNEGSKFLFGESYEDHFFAFKAIPVIFFFSSTISVLYYLGIIQTVIIFIGKIMEYSLKTSPSETICSAANIFLGMTEAPLLIRPLLKDLTESELHAIMTSGYATISGTVLSIYISFGIPASHLISASVMSAPASLAVSKLFYPETEKSKHTKIKKELINMEKSYNIIDAVSSGAVSAISLAACVACNLIVFIAIRAFLDASISWFFAFSGHPEINFQWILGRMFMPLAFMMGIEWKDCLAVGNLLGTKIVINEFIAYSDFINLVKDGALSARSQVITIYALCGFANIGSMGVCIGGFTALCSSLRPLIAKVGVRSVIAGNIACFMTACVAGIISIDSSNLYESLYQDVNNTYSA